MSKYVTNRVITTKYLTKDFDETGQWTLEF